MKGTHEVGLLNALGVEPQMAGFLRGRTADGGLRVEFPPEHCRLFGYMDAWGWREATT